MVSVRIVVFSATLSLLALLVSRGAASADPADDRDIRALIDDANLDSRFLNNEELSFSPLPTDLFVKEGHVGGDGPGHDHHSHSPTAAPSSTPVHLGTMAPTTQAFMATMAPNPVLMTTMAPNPVSIETMSPTMSPSANPTSGGNPSTPSVPSPGIPETATLVPTSETGMTSGAWSRVRESTAAATTITTTVGAMLAGAAVMMA